MNRPAMTAFAAAIAAANEFKSLLARLPAETPLIPGRETRLLESACYAEACSLLKQALSQVSQAAQGVGDERWVVLPLPSVISDQGANVPANQLELLAGVAVAIAQLALQIADECRSSGEDSRPLEIVTCVRRKVDLTGEQVEGKGNAIHKAASKEVVGQTLCHGEELVENLMKSAFDCPRDPRSPAYKLGARAVLAHRALKGDLVCKFQHGTAEFDAFAAGMDEGREIWRSQMRKEVP